MNSSAEKEIERRPLDRPIFLCGCHRSGTTLMQEVLKLHPTIDILPETKLFAWLWSPYRRVSSRPGPELVDALCETIPRLNRAWRSPENSFRLEQLANSKTLAPDHFQTPADVMDFVLRYGSQRSGIIRVGEKTPLHIYHVAALRKRFPDAKFVVLQRDLRAAYYSQLTRSKKTSLSYRPFRALNFVAAWRSAVGLADLYQRRYGEDSIHIVRFEELVEKPKLTLEAVCRFLDVEFLEDLMQVSFDNSSFAPVGGGFSATAANRWRTELERSESAELEYLAARQLAKLQYEPVNEKPVSLSIRTRLRLNAMKNALRLSDAIAKRRPELYCYLARDPRYQRAKAGDSNCGDAS